MNTKTVITLATTFFLTACMEKAETPQQVAQKYWNAIKTNDTATAKQLVSKDTQQSFENYVALSAKQKTAIGSINLDDEKATIATVIQPQGEALENQRQFETVLILEDGQWKVDASRTVPPPPKSDAEKELEELSKNLSESVQQNAGALDEAFKKGMETLNEALHEGSEEMGESFLKGLKQMNDALREQVEQMKKRRQQTPPVDQGAGEGVI